MKQKTSFLIYTLIIGLLVFSSSCSKDEKVIEKEKPKSIPTLTTTVVTEVSFTTATSGGVINSDGGAVVTARGICWSINQSPTINDNKTIDGSGTGNFTSSITDLLPGTIYYVRSYATNTEGTGYGNSLSFKTEDGVVDTDGNVYKIITIGKQTWMAENLKSLPSVVGPNKHSDTTPYYYVYGYEGTNIAEAKATDNYKVYGVLYNWVAAMAGSKSSDTNPSRVQGICPKGWHLPSNNEWAELVGYLGGEEIAGGKLKETGVTHWNNPNKGATNQSGFSALPGGYRGDEGVFWYINEDGHWWSATEYPERPTAWSVTLVHSEGNFYKSGLNTYKEKGNSVRCIKDK